MVLHAVVRKCAGALDFGRRVFSFHQKVKNIPQAYKNIHMHVPGMVVCEKKLRTTVALLRTPFLEAAAVWDSFPLKESDEPHTTSQMLKEFVATLRRGADFLDFTQKGLPFLQLFFSNKRKKNLTELQNFVGNITEADCTRLGQFVENLTEQKHCLTDPLWHHALKNWAEQLRHFLRRVQSSSDWKTLFPPNPAKSEHVHLIHRFLETRFQKHSECKMMSLVVRLAQQIVHPIRFSSKIVLYVIPTRWLVLWQSGLERSLTAHFVALVCNQSGIRYEAIIENLRQFYEEADNSASQLHITLPRALRALMREVSLFVSCRALTSYLLLDIVLHGVVEDWMEGISRATWKQKFFTYLLRLTVWLLYNRVARALVLTLLRWWSLPGLDKRVARNYNQIESTFRPVVDALIGRETREAECIQKAAFQFMHKVLDNYHTYFCNDGFRKDLAIK